MTRPDRGPRPRDGDVLLSNRFAGRLGGVLATVGSSIIGVMGVLRTDGTTTVLLTLLAAIGIATGAAMLRVDWDRHSSAALLVVLPIALFCLGINNGLNPDPFMGGVQYPCLSIWIGISQRNGVPTLFAPVLAAAYALPIALAGPWSDVWSAAAAMAVTCTFAGEPVAFLAGRLRAVYEEQRLSQERRYEAMLGQSSDFTVLLDAELTVRFVSRGVERMLGVLEVDGPPRLGELVHPDDLEEVRSVLAALAADPGGTAVLRARLRRADGTWAHTEAGGRNLLGDPDVGGLLMAVRDVSDRLQLERELERQATHDDLTGLRNRRGLFERLTRARAGTGTVAVLFCDLDGFKDINDELGHRAGDAVLCEVAARLVSLLDDRHTVARLGGDEFGVLLDRADEAEACRIAGGIAEVLERPMVAEDHTVVVSVSVGVAVVDLAADHSALDDVLADADLAMYAAKTDPASGRVRAYDPGLRTALVERTQLQRELRSGIRSGEIVVHYQPIVDLASGRVAGLEALARWQHPRRGLLPPALFVGLAERTGLVIDLNLAVMARACADLAELRRRSRLFDDVYVAVNTAAVQYADDALVELAGAQVSAHGLEAADLCLEVTESEPLTGAGAVDRVRRLRRMGFRVAIDDFGTGYSSLRYLHELAVHTIKIDKGFTDGVETGTTRALVRSIVQIARGLDLDTVAEGVEHPSQVRLLADMGVTCAQGYLFARPAPFEQVCGVVVGLTPGTAPLAPTT